MSRGVSALSCNTFTFASSNNISTSPDSATKTSGGGWVGSAYSVESYTNPISVTFHTSGPNNYFMGGFSYAPTANQDSYTNATFGLYIANNNLLIFENGNLIFTAFNDGNITTNDIFNVEYDGISVRYYYNNGLVYTSLQQVTSPLHLFFPILNVGGGVGGICLSSVQSSSSSSSLLASSSSSSLSPSTSSSSSLPSFVFIPSGVIKVSGCSGVGFKENYLVLFEVGSKVFVKKKIRQKKMEGIVIKRTNVTFPSVWNGVLPVVMYVDTLNRVWEEVELVSEEDALELLQERIDYEQRERRDYFSNQGCLPITPEGCG